MQTLLEQIAHGTPRRSGHRPQPANGSLPDLGYYEFVRQELLALIPNSARRVLDVGCGAGRLGEALKARQTAREGRIAEAGAAWREVLKISPDDPAAREELARTRYSPER